MPKAKKPKTAPVPHRMTLRSRRVAQVTPACSSNAPAARASPNCTTSTNNLPINHGILPPSTPINYPIHTSATTSSTRQRTAAQSFHQDSDEEYPTTQVVTSGRLFSQGTVRELGNVDTVLVDQDEPPTQALATPGEEPHTEVVGCGVESSNNMLAEMDNIPPPSAITEPATQAVMTARFSENQVRELANFDIAAIEVAEPSARVVDSTASFSLRILGQLGNVHSAATIAEEPDTQVVISAAYFPQETPKQSGNARSVPANDDVEATQVVPNRLPFSERMVGELGDVNLANIAISHPSATANGNEDDYGYDEGSTVRYGSDPGQPETITDGDTINDRALLEPQSSHPSEKSWARGSLTSSMRVAIGLLPNPLSNGRVRPVPETLGTPPPRYPCLVTITHYTCGHSYKQVEHYDRCIHDNGPSEKMLRAATPETPVLDGWGLAPSAQQPGRIPCSEKRTILLGGTQCEECRAER